MSSSTDLTTSGAACCRDDGNTISAKILNLCPYDIRVIVKDAEGTESEVYYPVHVVNGEKTIARAFVLANRIRIDQLENGVEVYEPPISDSVIGMPPDCKSNSPPDVIVPVVIAQSLKETYFGAVYAPNTRSDSVILNEERDVQAFKNLYRFKSRGWPANKPKNEYSIEDVLLKLEHMHSTDIKTIAVMFEDAVTGIFKFLVADDMASLYQLILPEVSTAREEAGKRGIMSNNFEQYGKNQVNYLDLIFTFNSTEMASEFIKKANQWLKNE